MPVSVKLSEALRGADVLRRIGDERAVTGVEYDSRRVEPGSLFVAMHGETTDGNRYIEQAVARGAVAVVTDSAAAYDDRSQRAAPGLRLLKCRTDGVRSRP